MALSSSVCLEGLRVQGVIRLARGSMQAFSLGLTSKSPGTFVNLKV